MRWGAESTAEIQLLMSLATHPMDQPKPFDMSSTDVLCRIQFRKTRMFLSFYERSFKIWLGAAQNEIGKESPDFQKAHDHLEKALQIPTVGENHEMWPGTPCLSSADLKDPAPTFPRLNR